MTDRQLADLLRRLEQDPLSHLSETEVRELDELAKQNPRVSEVLAFVREQQAVDSLLQQQVSLLKQDLSRLPVPAPPTANDLSAVNNRTVFLYALPIAALLVLAVTVFLWQKPESPLSENELAMPRLEQPELGGNGEGLPEKTDQIASPARKAPSGRQRELLAKKETATAGQDVFEVSGMAGPSGSVITRSAAPELAPVESPVSVSLSKEEQQKLLQKADQLWKALKQNPSDNKAKEELRQILQKLGDREGLRQLEMY